MDTRDFRSAEFASFLGARDRASPARSPDHRPLALPSPASLFERVASDTTEALTPRPASPAARDEPSVVTVAAATPPTKPAFNVSPPPTPSDVSASPTSSEVREHAPVAASSPVFKRLDLSSLVSAADESDRIDSAAFQRSTPTTSSSSVTSSPRRPYTSRPSPDLRVNAHQPLTRSIAKSAHSSPSATRAKKLFPCNMCGKTFGKKNHVARHIDAVHHNVRPFVCHLCSFPFQEKRGLARHLKVHDKQRLQRAAPGVTPIGHSPHYATSQRSPADGRDGSVPTAAAALLMTAAPPPMPPPVPSSAPTAQVRSSPVLMLDQRPRVGEPHHPMWQ